MPRGYKAYEFDDETSSSDPKGRWMGGSEYYKRTYRCLVPSRMTDDKQITNWIVDNEEKVVWLD